MGSSPRTATISHSVSAPGDETVGALRSPQWIVEERTRVHAVGQLASNPYRAPTHLGACRVAPARASVLT
eukprot:scaffold650_cov407-Prasinococcus_capsulatus_cf.AAC.42